MSYPDRFLQQHHVLQQLLVLHELHLIHDQLVSAFPDNQLLMDDYPYHKHQFFHHHKL